MKPYSKEIFKHFKNPKNMGKIKAADGVGEAGNFVCGDIMKLYLKIGENKKGGKIIKDVKFETLGCVVAIANTSLLTTLVKGKKIETALKIKKEDLTRRLGQPLPSIKIHCSVLAVDALREAIYDYLSKKKKPIPKELVEHHQRIEREKKLIEEKMHKK